MHNKNNSDESENASGDKQSKEYGGFYSTFLRVGDLIYIGDAVVIITKIKFKANGVVIGIRAPKNQPIIKGTGAKDG